MKNWLIWFVWLIVLLSLIGGVLADVRVNEVELNPAGNDNSYEWIELYSDEEVDLTDWKIMRADGNNITFNASFSEYYVLDTSFPFLTNKDQKLFLINSDGDIINETIVFDDEGNNDKTWQYCDGDWNFIDSTKGSANSCEEDGNEVDEEEVYLELDWDEDEIINEDEFDIKVRAYNLESGKKYDIKVYIKFEDENTVISEIYNDEDEDDERWESGTYYIDEIMSGRGDKSETFSLRIKEKYEYFDGDAEIIAKIRISGSSSAIDEVKENINILKPEKVIDGDENGGDEETTGATPITGAVITLGRGDEEGETETGIESEDIKTQKNIVYESKSERIKKYSIFGFAILCVGLSILIIFNKLK